MLIAIISAIVGLASFFGLWKNAGKILGKLAAIKQKKIQNKTLELIKDEKVKQLTILKFKQANEYLASESGKRKMDWVVNSVCNSIAGNIDDIIFREAAQGWYEDYSAEILKH